VQADEGKTMREWKLIEIESGTVVKEHFTFLHPAYDYQKLYFNNRKDYMIEALDNWRAFLYKAVPP
jgi:hypothetical protein